MNSIKKEVSNPQQGGSINHAGFIIIFVVMVFGWFALHHPSATINAPQPATHVALSSLASSATDGFGRWGVVARPMLFLLNWVYYHVVANWGWAIVVLTALINVAL